MTGGPLPSALWLANATVQVCAHPATPTCTPVTTYNDANGDAACPFTAPLVQLPGVNCVASTGSAANVGFWYGGGIVDYIVTSTYGTFGPFTISQGSAGSGSFVSLTDTSPQNMAGQLNAPGYGTLNGTVIPAATPGYTGTAGSALVLATAPVFLDPSGNTDPTCDANALWLTTEAYVNTCSGTGSMGTVGQVQAVGATAGSFAATSITDNGTSVAFQEPITVNGAITANALGIATGTANNYGSFSGIFNLSYWNGSATVADNWTYGGLYICPYTSCGGTPTTTFNVYGPSSLTGNTFLLAQNASILATSGANIPTMKLGLRGATWNGSASQLDDWDIQGTYGTGANPTATLVISKGRGTTGAAVVQMPAATFTGGTPGFGATAALFSTYPACTSATDGLFEEVSDSTTTTWGATVTGTGTASGITVTMHCNNTNWTVVAK